MLNLDYAPEVPVALREVIEHHARALGIPLSDVERMGQSLDLAERFVVAAEQGRGVEFATHATLENARVLLPGAHTALVVDDPHVRA